MKSGAYSSASEVLRAAIRALDHEESALDTWLKARVDEAFEDGTKNLRASEVFKQLRAHHTKQIKRGE